MKESKKAPEKYRMIKDRKFRSLSHLRNVLFEYLDEYKGEYGLVNLIFMDNYTTTKPESSPVIIVDGNIYLVGFKMLGASCLKRCCFLRDRNEEEK